MAPNSSIAKLLATAQKARAFRPAYRRYGTTPMEVTCDRCRACCYEEIFSAGGETDPDVCRACMLTLVAYAGASSSSMSSSSSPSSILGARAAPTPRMQRMLDNIAKLREETDGVGSSTVDPDIVRTQLANLGISGPATAPASSDTPAPATAPAPATEATDDVVATPMCADDGLVCAEDEQPVSEQAK